MCYPARVPSGSCVAYKALGDAPVKCEAKYNENRAGIPGAYPGGGIAGYGAQVSKVERERNGLRTRGSAAPAQQREMENEKTPTARKSGVLLPSPLRFVSRLLCSRLPSIVVSEATLTGSTNRFHKYTNRFHKYTNCFYNC